MPLPKRPCGYDSFLPHLRDYLRDIVLPPLGRTRPGKTLFNHWLSAFGEAETLLTFEARTGETIEDVLTIDESAYKDLVAFVKAHPEEEGMVEQAIEFRKMVQKAVAVLRALDDVIVADAA